MALYFCCLMPQTVSKPHTVQIEQNDSMHPKRATFGDWRAFREPRRKATPSYLIFVQPRKPDGAPASSIADREAVSREVRGGSNPGSFLPILRFPLEARALPETKLLLGLHWGFPKQIRVTVLGLI